jgi:hypothetical protein
MSAIHAPSALTQPHTQTIGDTTPQTAVAHTDSRLLKLIKATTKAKAEERQIAIKNRFTKKSSIFGEAVMAGGDLFSAAYLVLSGVQAAFPVTKTLSAFKIISPVCGIIAGTINISVGAVCIKESMQAFNNGDKKLGRRLLIDGIFMIAIGTIMILTSVVVKGAIAAFLATHPWLLPVLFFISSIPVLYEISSRVINIWTKQDHTSKMHLSELREEINKDDLDIKAIFKLYEATTEKGNELFNFAEFEKMIEKLENQKLSNKNCDPIMTSLKEKIEDFQANMGINNAIESFKLFQLLMHLKLAEGNPEKLDKIKPLILKKITKLEKTFAEWNKAQHVRLTQQLLFFVSFIVSMVTLNPNLHSGAIDAADSFAMAGANAIPFAMDIFWPFKRNIPIVVPEATDAKIFSQLKKIYTTKKN